MPLKKIISTYFKSDNLPKADFWGCSKREDTATLVGEKWINKAMKAKQTWNRTKGGFEAAWYLRSQRGGRLWQVGYYCTGRRYTKDCCSDHPADIMQFQLCERKNCNCTSQGSCQQVEAVDIWLVQLFERFVSAVVKGSVQCLDSWRPGATCHIPRLSLCNCLGEYANKKCKFYPSLTDSNGYLIPADRLFLWPFLLNYLYWLRGDGIWIWQLIQSR